MRKVLSFVLVLSLVLGSFGMAFAANATVPSDKKLSDINGQACEDAVRVLTSLDVVSGYQDGTYKPEQTVTRAEMASLIIKALGLKETDAVPKFADSKTHWAKGYIAYANTLGIISGRSETVFDPDATVTYDEATTMLVKALGYTDEALNGTYPASFVSRAKVLGILDGIQTGTAGANRGDVAIMLYQTLDQAIGKVDKDGNFVATVIEWEKNGGNATQAKKYDTMLDRLGAEIFQAKSNYKRTDVDDDAFLLTGDEDSVINLTPFKGAVVTAYVNSDDDIIAIKEVFTTFVSGKFDNANFDTDTPFILADGTEYTLKQDALNQIAGTISSKDGSAAVDFLNGDVKNDFDAKITATDTVYTLAVELSGKKITDVHSVMRWEMKTGDMVDADDIKDIEANHKLLGVDFDEDNNGDIDLDSFELIGVASLDKIEKDHVVYVYENSDKKISRVAVGTETVTGEVTKQNASKTKITIDGVQYKYASDELVGNKIVSDALSNTKIDTEDEVKLYLDAYGYIFDYDKVSGTADNYAVVLKTENKEDNKISSNAKVKLFLADGTYKVFNVDEDEVLDNGIIGSTDSDAVGSIGSLKDGQWNANITTGAIIKYGLNKDGVITSIEANGAADPDNKMVVTKKTGIDITAKGYYDGALIAEDAVLFNMDGKVASDDEDDYTVAKYEKVLDSDKVDAHYVYDEDDKEIKAMLLFDVTSSNDVYGVVNSYGKNNSSAGAYYNMLVDGKEVSYNGDKNLVSKDSIKALKRIKYDAAGDVSDLKTWVNGKDDVKLVTFKATASNLGKLNNRTFTATGMVGTAYNSTTVGSPLTISNNQITLDKDAYIYVWDKNDDEWQLGSTSDLRNLEAGYTVEFYDVEDEDSVYDIVLIYEVAKAPADDTQTEVTDGGVLEVSSAAITTLEKGTYDIQVFNKNALLGSKIENVRSDGSFKVTAQWLAGEGVTEINASIGKADETYEVVIYKAGTSTEVKSITIKTKNVGPQVTAVSINDAGAVTTAAVGAFDTDRMTVTAKTLGTAGNSTTVELKSTTGALTVTFAGLDVTVEAPAGTTYGAIADAINKSEAAKVVRAESNSTVAYTAKKVTLAGGVDMKDAKVEITLDENASIESNATVTLVVDGNSYTGAVTVSGQTLTMTIKAADLKAVLKTGDAVKITAINGVKEAASTGLKAVVPKQEFKF